MKHMHEKLGVLLWHNNHFVGCIASKSRRTLFVYDSLIDYKKADLTAILLETVHYFDKLWSTSMSYQAQLCDVQLPGSNDCGVHVLNNVSFDETYTRETMIEFMKKE